MSFEKYFRGWKLGIGNTVDPVHYVEAGEMRIKKVLQSGNETKMIWKGHESLGDDFEVVAVWHEINGRYEAQIHYDNYCGKEFIEEIIFPILELDFSKDCEFIFCKDMGCRLKGETLFKPGSRQNIGFTAMQFCALINSGSGCYVDHRDAHGNIKYAAVEISQDGTKFTYLPVYLQSLGEKPAESGRIPYITSVMEFTGSWFEAAVIYREWALRQQWSLNRTGTVNPLRDIGMWIWNRGLAEDVMAPVERLHKDLPGIRLALDWYWWHQNPYDTDYPDFWPPREGKEHFRRSVERMTGQGIFTQVYANGVCWDLDGPSWAEGGEESIIIRRNREPDFNVFNKYNNHRLGMMCGDAPKFHDRISNLVKKLADYGLSGQYLDIIGGISYEACYNPAHRHGLGGGNHCVEGYRRMLRRLKDENPDFPLTTEYANEVYMDLFDGAIICNSTSAEHFGGAVEYIPLFSAVYHGYFALFGNYAHPDGIPPWDPLWPSKDRWKEEKKWHKLYPEQFFVEMARPVIWGAQPMVCNLKLNIMNDPEFAGIYAFIRHTAEFYHRNRGFLFDGEMLSPDGFDCSSREVKFMMRMIFTKESNFKVNTRTMPSLLHSCWMDRDGNRALFIANYTEEEQKWSFRGKKGVIAPRSYVKIGI